MKVTLAAVADYASIAEGGKLNVMGVFDRITAHAFPVRHPFMAFAFRIYFAPEESGKPFRLEVALEDAGGREGIKFQGDARAPDVDMVHGGQGNNVLAIRDLVFEEAGTYSIHVRVDDETLATVPIVVSSAGE